MKSKVEQQGRRLVSAEWLAEGERRFGKDQFAWRFVCPSCGHIASVSDYKAAGAPEGAVAFSCVGRWLPNPKDAFSGAGGPCNYAGGGLFRVNPIILVTPAGESNLFEFAE